MTLSIRWSRGGLRRMIAVCAVAGITLVLFEAGARILARGGYLQVAMSEPGAPEYWDGRHEPFGVWRHPGATWRHVTPCFDVHYQASSIGTRDVERNLAGEDGRVVVLGDSFLEGWGLPLRQRLTNLLESESGVEHLNFAMSHFGTYQQLLSYRHLAKRYSHDKVLVGIVPVNDFVDLDYSLATQMPGYEYHFRPYLRGNYPSYDHYDFREPWYQRFPRRHSYAYNALVDRLHGMLETGPRWESPHLTLTHSFFYDFTDAQFDLMRFSLEQLMLEAGGREVVVVLLPTFLDFARFYQVNSEESPLTSRLRSLGDTAGFRVVDLLAPMFRDDPHWKYYFLACDYHYNELGNRIAFESLVEALGPEFY